MILVFHFLSYILEETDKKRYLDVIIFYDVKTRNKVENVMSKPNMVLAFRRYNKYYFYLKLDAILSYIYFKINL